MNAAPQVSDDAAQASRLMRAAVWSALTADCAAERGSQADALPPERGRVAAALDDLAWRALDAMAETRAALSDPASIHLPCHPSSARTSRLCRSPRWSGASPPSSAAARVQAFDDQISQAVLDLLGHPARRHALQARYEHVLVDEFQDLNAAQLTLVDILSRPHRRLFVVGDDDQLIYGWRFAQVENILAFPDACRCAPSLRDHHPDHQLSVLARGRTSRRHADPPQCTACGQADRLPARMPRPGPSSCARPPTGVIARPPSPASSPTRARPRLRVEGPGGALPLPRPANAGGGRPGRRRRAAFSPAWRSPVHACQRPACCATASPWSRAPCAPDPAGVARLAPGLGLPAAELRAAGGQPAQLAEGRARQRPAGPGRSPARPSRRDRRARPRVAPLSAAPVWRRAARRSSLRPPGC